MLGAAPEQVIIANDSSLSLMHDTVVYSLLKGTCDSSIPWSKQEEEFGFRCPVPGNDPHFKICEDLDQVEQLGAQDASVKAMWCVPKYTNPTGTVYSDSVIERLAAMKTAVALCVPADPLAGGLYG